MENVDKEEGRKTVSEGNTMVMQESRDLKVKGDTRLKHMEDKHEVVGNIEKSTEKNNSIGWEEGDLTDKRNINQIGIIKGIIDHMMDTNNILNRGNCLKQVDGKYSNDSGVTEWRSKKEKWKEKRGITKDISEEISESEN